MKKYLAFLLSLLLLTGCAQLETTTLVPETYKVISVADGDTLTVLSEGTQKIKIRLAEIDAPESKMPYGQRAKQALSELTFGKMVALDMTSKDRYGRSVAYVLINGENLNLEMVRRGMAWCYTAYLPKQSTCPQIEEEARNAQRGLWADKDPMPPWEWRKEKKAK